MSSGQRSQPVLSLDPTWSGWRLRSSLFALRSSPCACADVDYRHSIVTLECLLLALRYETSRSSNRPLCMCRLLFAIEIWHDCGNRSYVSGLLIGSRAVALMGLRTRLGLISGKVHDDHKGRQTLGRIFSVPCSPLSRELLLTRRRQIVPWPYLLGVERVSVAQNAPGGAGKLVGQGNGCLFEACRPPPRSAKARSCRWTTILSHHDHLRRLDEQRAQVPAAPFGDPPKDRSAACAVLGRHQTDPSAQSPALGQKPPPCQLPRPSRSRSSGRCRGWS